MSRNIQVTLVHHSLLSDAFCVSEVQKTPEFKKWLDGLKDKAAKARIETRIIRLGLGLLGDVKAIREGVSELRIDFGPGYRVYFVKRGQTFIILLAGGTKKTQSRDIAFAIDLANHF